METLGGNCHCIYSHETCPQGHVNNNTLKSHGGSTIGNSGACFFKGGLGY